MVVFTTLGTVACIIVAFAVDSYSFATRSWRWGEHPVNNVIIPLILAPPFFSFSSANCANWQSPTKNCSSSQQPIA